MVKATRRTTTSRPKLAKTDVKRSAPVHSAPANHVGPGGWFISPTSSVLGTELLQQFKRAIRDHELLDEHKCITRADIAYSAAQDISKMLALVPPRGPEEALAAAIMLYDEACDIDQANIWTEARCQEWSLRMKQRASALASWIETTHKVCRHDFRLDYFCHGGARDEVLPHMATALNVIEPSAAV
jgi:hypothetical protein